MNITTAPKIFSLIREVAHDALAPLGIIAFFGGAIAACLGRFGVPQESVLAVISAAGAGAATFSKWTDSRSFTDIQTAVTSAAAGDARGALAAGEQAAADAGIPVPPSVA